MTDRALEWMSYRRSGKIGDLPGELISTAGERRFVDNAVTLGHAEWTSLNTWKIAPPVLAGLPMGGGIAAVLCGARTAKLLDCLTKACSAAGTQLKSVRRDGQPATVTVMASSLESLADTAKRANIPLQTEAAFRILACTPSIREWPRTPSPMVQGRVESVRRFSKSKMDWVVAHAPLLP